MNAAPARERIRRSDEDNDRETRRRGDSRLAQDIDAIEDVALSVADDVFSLAQAWNEANVESFKGIVSIIGNLVLDLNESVSLVGEPLRHREEGRRRRRGKEGEQEEEAEERESVSSGITRISRSLSDALRDTATVIQRSGDRFQRRYERTASSVRRGETHRAEGEGASERIQERKEEATQRPPTKPAT